MREAFARSGSATILANDEVIEAGAQNTIAVGGHHIGIARMNKDPRLGVVDSHCRTHDIANLYIAGSAVFPTSGSANPTLTIVALAIRIADRLKAGASSL
jgi:choline dehydrogenase-like flavoprotein